MSRTDRYEYKDWMGFGNRIKKYREQVGLSKEKFAEKINRSENFVKDIEKGRTSASIHTLYQISKVLGVTTDSLLYGENMDENKEYTNKELLQNIIDRCDEEELGIIKDIIIAIFPNLSEIKTKRNHKKD